MARPFGPTLRAPPHAQYALASRLDRRDHPRFHLLVADRTCPSLFHTREQKNVVLEQPGSLAEQDGADAVQDGPYARPHGAPRFRLWLRPALERQPRLRRIPHRDTAAARGGAGRVQELPRPSASRQGQGRVRPVHGTTQDAPDPAADRPAARLISRLISGLTPLKAVRRMPPKS